MNPEHERFAELATRSLEHHPDLRDEARGELFGRLAHSGGDPASASERLEASRPRSAWMIAGYAALAFVTLGLCAGWQGKAAWSEVRTLASIMNFGSGFEPHDRMREHLDSETCDFVFAGIGHGQEVQTNLQRQWELHPDQPGIYEELIHRRIEAEKGLPADFSETWRRFDPDNGLWLYLEAVGRSQEWKRKGPASAEPFSREVLDLLRQSAAAPRFQSYWPELRNRRLGMLPPSDTLAEETELLLYSISALWEPTVRHQRDAVITFGKAAEQAAKDKDAGEVTALIHSWERLTGRLSADGSSLLGLMVPAISWNDNGKALLQASRDLGLREHEARLDDLQKQFADYRASYRPSPGDPRAMSSIARVLMVGSLPEIAIDNAIFEPGRRVEYAVTERMLGLAAAIVVLLFLAAAGIESFRRGRRVNGLAAGLGPLFRPVDFLWTAALGVVFPALWYLALTRWTPFGLRDVGMTHYKPQPILIQAGAALVFALLMMVQTVRWRLAVRAGFLALKPARPWVGWTMAAIAAAVIPLAGGVRWLSGNEERYLQAIAATGGLPLLWLLWEAGSVIFSSRGQALGGVLLCRRMIVPLTMLAALLLACWSPLLATERHWHARDQVIRADRQQGGLTILESRVVERVRERIRKAFPESAGVR